MKRNIISGRRSKKLLSLLLASIVFLFLSSVLSTILPGGSTMTLILEADHIDQAQFYWWNGRNHSGFIENNSDTSREYQANLKKDIRVSASDSSLYRLRIDPGRSAGVYRIYHLELQSHYTSPVVFSGKDLIDYFNPGHDGVSLELDGDALVVTATRGDPYIISKEKLQKVSGIYRYALPLLFSFLFYILLTHTRFSNSRFIVFKDIEEKGPSTGKNINSLDGLRGLAALTVIGDHSWGLFKGTGFSGVLIFFALSGFLLAMPFVQDSSRSISFSYMVKFFKRRIRRILPIYYLIIFIYYCFDLRWDVAIRHFLFLQGNGHFWAIPQEMFFYLLLPFFVIILHFLFRKNPFLCLVFLMVCIMGANSLLDQDVISLYGMMDQKIRAFVGIFLGGMFFSYLYFSDWFQDHLEENNGTLLKKATGIIGMLIVVILVFFSNNQLWGGSFVYAQHYFELYGFLAALLVFCVAVARGTFLERLMTMRWLRSIGLVSLSLYLIHPSIISMIREFTQRYAGVVLKDAPLFFSTVIIGYMVACVSYVIIEKSFYGANVSSRLK